MNEIQMRFAVVTRVASPEAGEGGNMATALGLCQPIPGSQLLEVRPAPASLQLQLRMPVFHLGEILILDPDGREPHGLGRCPSKWDVDLAFFDDLNAAVAKARKIAFDETAAYGQRTAHGIMERNKERPGG